MSHSAAILWDTDLIRRYDQAGPRYTSYPTALSFTAVEKPTENLSAALAGAITPAPCRSIYTSPFVHTSVTTAAATRW